MGKWPPEPLGFCETCGETFYSPEVSNYYKKPHQCEVEKLDFPTDRHTKELLHTLINANLLLSGKHWDSPERIKAQIRRTLWKYKIDKDDVFWSSLRTDGVRACIEDIL